VRVVIGEDETLLRAGLELVLEEAGFEIAGVAGSAPELVRCAAAEAPDLVIADIRMPPGHADDGLRSARDPRRTPRDGGPRPLPARQPPLRDGAARGAGRRRRLPAQAADRRRRDLLPDVQRVADGGTALDPVVVDAMLARVTRDDDAIAGLTGRPRDVLALLAEGRSNAAIARRLVITEKAVVGHVSHIYEHLGLGPSEDDHRRVLAVLRYLSCS
jgi:DNA-binding NarL/FixJ family response regulator